MGRPNSIDRRQEGAGNLNLAEPTRGRQIAEAGNHKGER